MFISVWLAIRCLSIGTYILLKVLLIYLLRFHNYKGQKDKTPDHSQRQCFSLQSNRSKSAQTDCPSRLNAQCTQAIWQKTTLERDRALGKKAWTPTMLSITLWWLPHTVNTQISNGVEICIEFGNLRVSRGWNPERSVMMRFVKVSHTFITWPDSRLGAHAHEIVKHVGFSFVTTK